MSTGWLIVALLFSGVIVGLGLAAFDLRDALVRRVRIARRRREYQRERQA